MQGETIKLDEQTGAAVEKNAAAGESISMTGSYTVECVGPDGQVKWQENIENLVVNVGKIDILDKYFSGSAYTAAWYLGLVDGGSVDL